MTKPIIYGLDGSPPVRTVLLVANAIGLDFEFKEIDMMAGEHRTAEFVKKNPQHTVPVLEDGQGKYLWDSHAISTYLIGKYAKNDSLYPKDLFVRAQIDQRLHFDSSVLSIRLGKLIGPVMQNKGGITEEAKESVAEAFDFLEKFLGSNNYLVGNNITVADLSMISTLSSINVVFPVDSVKFPKLSAWKNRVTQLPYYEKANGVGLAKLEAYINMKIAEIK